MFTRHSVDIVILPKPLLTKMHLCRQACLPNETGGFLLGHRREGSIEIVSFTPEQAGDYATRFSFTRAGLGHASQIKQQWVDSAGVLTLVGDWHSHPSGGGTPSFTDKKAWNTLLKSTKLPIIGIIIGEYQAYEAHLVYTTMIRSSARRLDVLQNDGEDNILGFEQPL